MGKRRHRAKTKPKPKASLLRKIIHWLWELFTWLLGLIAGGLLTSFFPGVNEALKTTIENTSITLGQKFLDFRYASAARCNVSDLSMLASCWVTYMFVVLLWMLLARTIRHVRDTESNLEARKDKASLLDKIKSAPQAARAEIDLKAIQAENNRKIKYLGNILPRNRMVFKVQLYVTVIGSIYMILIMLLLVDSHFLLTSFQRKCTMIRPYITENEFNILNQRWVLIESESDYLALVKQIVEYAERSALPPSLPTATGESGIPPQLTDGTSEQVPQ